MKRLGEFAFPVPAARLAAKGPDCATCEDSGWKPVPAADGRPAGVTRCPDCWERRRGVTPGVPDDEAKTSVDDWAKGQREIARHNEAALLQAKFFLQDVHPGLYLHGPVGCGKTALACAILNDLHRAGKRVRFQRVTDLLKQLVQGETGDQVYQRMIDVPVLVLDDIGAQKPTDYARQTLLVIYDARTDRGHRTIWTSNLDLEGLITFFGDDARLASRIAGNAKIVSMEGGPDYRLRKAKRRH